MKLSLLLKLYYNQYNDQDEHFTQIFFYINITVRSSFAQLDAHMDIVLSIL